MKKIILFLLISLTLIFGCVEERPVACTEDARMCPDGSAVSRVGPDCEFEECPDTDGRDSEVRTYCTEDQRGAEICTANYDPVCGWNDPTIQCIKYPCANTYSNICQACGDENVEYWTRGECPE